MLKKKFSKGRKAILTKSGNYVDFKKLIYDEEVERYIQQHFKGLDKPSDIKSFMDFTKFLAKNDQLSLQAC